MLEEITCGMNEYTVFPDYGRHYNTVHQVIRGWHSGHIFFGDEKLGFRRVSKYDLRGPCILCVKYHRRYNKTAFVKVEEEL